MTTHCSDIRKTYKYRMYTSPRRDKHLHQAINVAGMIWNHALALQRRYYRLTGKYIDPGTLKKHLAKLRMTRKSYAYWQNISAQSVQEIVERLDAAYQRFFAKKGGLPRFKKVKKFKSFVLKQSNWKLLADSKVKLNAKGEFKSAVGHICINGRKYKFIKHRQLDGTIKTITIKRDALNRLWICFSVVETIEIPNEASTGQIGGFDFGLKTLLTNDQGRAYTNPQFLRKELATIKRLCRQLSRKQEGSHNYTRAKTALARAHIRIADKRQDYHFKLAHQLCKDYQALVFEDLNLSAMKRLWGRKVSDLGFATFLQHTQTKAFQSGVRFCKINRFERTTQKCSACEHHQSLSLRERIFLCEQCGLELDRDHNAAINIMYAGASAFGLEVRQTPSGAALFEATSPRL